MKKPKKPKLLESQTQVEYPSILEVMTLKMKKIRNGKTKKWTMPVSQFINDYAWLTEPLEDKEAA